MKPFFFTLSLLSIGVTAYSQNYFKGTLYTTQNDVTAKNQKTTWQTDGKNNYFKTSFEKGDIDLLINTEAIYVMFPTDKTYIKQEKTSTNFLNLNWDNAVVAKTGNTQTINGVSCNEFTVKTKEATATIWLSNDNVIINDFATSSALKQLYLNKFTGLPYKIEVVDNSNTVMHSSEISSVLANKFDPSVFVLPNTYKPFQITNNIK